ncbi:hypothetical protein Taro_038181 [Colocasia esculenta]|uniref:Uncharacterized protein n=1 Tax=Colocasia esculenta TaxID=4460 RepID=A0A843WF38_COLES|nr:hypothetical protein [Colocasia esculenta]
MAFRGESSAGCIQNRRVHMADGKKSPESLDLFCPFDFSHGITDDFNAKERKEGTQGHGGLAAGEARSHLRGPSRLVELECIYWIEAYGCSTLRSIPYQGELGAAEFHGAALVLGGWTFDRSLNFSVGRILVAHGTRMQKELAKINSTEHLMLHGSVMTKSLQNPSSPISKIFYAEHVYDDTTRDKPLIRWRARNLYEDNVTVADSLKDSSSSKNLPSGSEPKEHTWKTSGDTIAGLSELIADPLDCVLGYSEAGGGETPQSAGVVSRRELRAHRRRRRRHQMRHEKSYSDHASSETLTV